MASFFRFFFITIATMICITVAILVRILTGSAKKGVWWAHSWWAPWILWLGGTKLIVKGQGNFDPKKPYVFICNHQSFFDIPCVFAALPTHLHFVAKKELKKFPFIGAYMAAMGMIFIDRTNKVKAIESLRKAGELIRKGKSVITFPEGTRSKTGEIGKFKKGTFLLAAEAGVDIVPIKIEGMRAVWPAERVHLTPGTVTVKIGKPVSSQHITKDNVIEVCKEMRELVQNL